MSGLTCASAGCHKPVVRRPGQLGRPPIYCSPACRPSRSAVPGRSQISVEVDEEEHDGDWPGRCWVVRLRRGRRSVIVGRDLGRFSARILSGELRTLLHPRTRQEGDAIE